MYKVSDEELARRLDREINHHQGRAPVQMPYGYDAANAARNKNLNATVNIVNDEWELVDPTPDIHALFRAFDARFFKSKLQCVQVEWSKKMYNCAGICYLRSNSTGKSCTIRLSEPLLKLRPRKDLVETLLHEMIHAYCFVQGIREGNGGHGPTFLEIMRSINKVAGTNISVYHNFHDEVNLYRTHVWRCNGICQHRGPFYGYVRRAVNRAPNSNDYWWTAHKQSCGGYFEKIKEPDNNNKTSKTNVGTLTKKTSKDISTYFVPSSSAGKAQDTPSHDVGTNVRNIWQNKFSDPPQKPPVEEPSAKRPKTPEPSTSKQQGSKTEHWNQIDDDVYIEEPNITVIDLVDSPAEKKKLTPEERQSQIKKEILDSINMDGTVIELIDDEYDEDDLSAINTVLDESVIEDLFGKDTLMDEFKKVNPNKTDSASDFVTCPVCQNLMERDMLSSHLEGCLGIVQDVPYNPKTLHKPIAKKMIPAKKEKNHPKSIVVPESPSSTSPSSVRGVKRPRNVSNPNESFVSSLQTDPLVPCPVCNDPIIAGQINDHLDICLLRENADNMN